MRAGPHFCRMQRRGQPTRFPAAQGCQRVCQDAGKLEHPLLPSSDNASAAVPPYAITAQQYNRERRVLS
ncbi:hypothetical protein HBI81_037400 [Parastagonospora nodorum]|nr:hypothetical protein HBH82_093640 [Parastagonospora nodorum]KAH4714791.1 hypothetical protein HBH78_038590 [Parastagonospora nodorum]KAH4784936.1 hypothetical protein HBH62_095570 [Parastagonospora nodorum]KAH4838725.1 hypothetical protein HBH63_013680 [Parastagonospora nodorum]KAH5235047.1 hypothetical protein HBI62_036640 [Parastagonospora nodorum]